MRSYRTDVATLDVPATWQDKSITAFRLPAAPGLGDASFVITKDASKGVTPFAAYVDKQVETCRRSLADYREIKRDAFEAAGRNAAWLEFEWDQGPRPDPHPAGLL